MEIKNGGTVEYSFLGVYAAKPNASGEGYDANYYGGIIQCDSAFFLNNTTAVQLFNYSNNSAGYFRETTFETNDDYFGEDDPLYFVKMYNMTGIDFEYCTFVNNSSSITSQRGVNAYNTSANFEGECTAGDPCTSWNEGLFKNLYYGIYAYTSLANKYVDVRNTKFEDNFRGLQISGSDGCRVTSNTFKIDTAFAEDGGCGLYLNSSTAYWVEENIFYNDSTDSPVGLGLVVNSSGTDANEIYRNDFYNLDQGISAQEINHGRVTGLQILCNEFDTCIADIFVPDPVASKAGIAPNQGVANSTDPEDMAGNEFFYEESSTDFDDINNEADGFDYFYDNNLIYNVKPEDYYGVDLEDVTTILDWTPENGCPSQISSGGGGLKSTGLTYIEQLEYYSGMIESTKATLVDLVDGGDTETLNTEVELSTPPETMDIYTELLNESPYLSETVVESTIEKENVLPNAMVRDVMVANPQSANSDQLIEKLDERIVPMPEYMKAQILQGKSIVSLKQELESELANYKLKQARAINGLIREYREYAINPESAYDSIVSLYESLDDKNIKYRLAMLYLQRNEYAEGLAVLSSITTNNSLNSDELAEHYSFVDYFNLLNGINQNGRTELGASEDEIQEFHNIVQTSDGIAGAYARNVLIALEELEYLAPIQLPNLYKSSKEVEELQEIMNSKPPSQLNVFPNPSKGYVIVEYHLEMEKEGGIEIKDVNGITVKLVDVSMLQDQVTIITKNWKPGIYIATLKIDGKPLESCKFTLVK